MALIARHIAEENPHAATRIAQELLVAGDSLNTFPYRGRPGLIPDTWELVSVRPYLIIYEIVRGAETVQTVRILRVWHGARDRSEWIP